MNKMTTNKCKFVIKVYNTVHVEFFILANSTGSEYFVPTFRYTLSVPSS